MKSPPLSHTLFSRFSSSHRPGLSGVAFLAVLAMVVLMGCDPKQETKVPAKTSSLPQTASAPSHPLEALDWANFETGANVKTLAFENNQIWLGMPSGVIRYDTSTPDQHEVYTTTSTNGGLLGRGIYVIRIDPEGNKWIGTYGGGLTKYDGKTWKTYTVADGLGDQWIYDIVWDKNGSMWVATWDGVSVFDGTDFKTYREADGLADKWVYSIALDQDDIFWFGTEAGVSRFDPSESPGKAWTTYTHQEGLGAEMDSPESQVPQSDDSMISAGPTTNEGYAEGSESAYGVEGLRHHMDPSKANVGSNPDFVVASVVDRMNHKWFGTWGAGLSRFDGTSWKTYTDADGLGGNFVHALALDSEGNIWAGTNGGASWFDGKKWFNLTERDGLLNNNVFSVAFDDKGRRWFGTWEGLSMYSGTLSSSLLP